jgi:ankyrin repeat protein
VQYLTATRQIDIEVKDDEGRTPLHLACYAGSIEIAKHLIEKQNANINAIDTKKRNVCHFACISGCLELVKYISKRTEVDVNAQDEDGSTALHLTCQIGENKYIKVVRFLITDMKANLHSVNNKGETPLHVAWIAPISKFLVIKGANVLAKDKSGKSPLHTQQINFLKAATKR